jgi:Ca2+/Na+ antiporter
MDMTLNNIIYVAVTLGRALEHNPGRLVPFVAGACVVTLIIAIISDAWLRTRPAREKKPAVARIHSNSTRQ